VLWFSRTSLHADKTRIKVVYSHPIFAVVKLSRVDR
jgi:hypothetical protein